MLKFLRKTIPSRHPLRLFWHKLKAMFAAMTFRFPARRMTIIGITGTNGKTTTVALTAKILEKAGFQVGVASTVFFKVANREWQNTSHMTSLSPFALQRLLRKMVLAGCTQAVLEVSSHALSQHRVWGIPFDAVGITNISPEHMDYHVSMKNYRADKAKLFELIVGPRKLDTQAKTMVLNLDDEDTFFDLVKLKAERKIGYSRKAKSDSRLDSTFHARGIDYRPDGSRFEIVHGNDKLEVTTSLSGSFNVENILCASALAIACGASLTSVSEALLEVRHIPGRMEEIREGQPFRVFIDFAMTEDGYKRMLKVARQMSTGNVWIVFGCCGDRDKAKRPVIGELCARLADRVVVCDDEPWTENPEAIRSMVLKGIRSTERKESEEFWEIPDRKEALLHAFRLAKEDDIIIVPGMGDFEGRMFADGVMEWNEREVIRNLLHELYG